ncbi:hypothetical protein [Streptomyces sp. NPDC048309]|uniref:hypothetical protein n=1 Tax=unclassified Streptomyces TaxID=2593676 RepID=UPI003401EF72
MNDTPSSAGSTAADEAPADLVQVVLGTCSADDAETVLRALGSRFEADPDLVSDTRRDARTHPDTWADGFLVSHSAAPLPEAALSGPVTAELQGGPVAVARLRETLASAFAVEDTGSVSGDQEVDLQLRLTTAAH